MNREKAIQIRKLDQLTLADYSSLGNTGYCSDAVYDLSKQGDPQHFSISFALRRLEQPYQKYWSASAEDLEDYNLTIVQGHSFGAYLDEQLVGLLIAEERTWNNSLWIEYLEVNAMFQGLGFGAALIKQVVAHARTDQFRLVMLETQNTNVPAIRFYKKQGFVVDGVQLSLYHEQPGEQAVFMVYHL
ncbi:GNAT family N-acetyltransferase [Pedobacter caeni]|uniref:Acetyltransferase (GNAT) family protein n=1 Tax=Pedobacter caeni TaxID=288992 RepID=A0A1M5H608_9SPHI|nr:GNAT family N-acetyltransferase [Pedobacter caeni]SHG11427.1 Acetyltransferase (GNAT) family protein [Pedobacter caeni]